MAQMMKREDTDIDQTRGTEKERVGETTEREGRAGERVKLDTRGMVLAREDRGVGQTLEAGLAPNHLVYDIMVCKCRPFLANTCNTIVEHPPSLRYTTTALHASGAELQ